MSTLRAKWIAEQQVSNPSLKDTLDFRGSFRFGRTTASAEDCTMGELPNPEGGCDEFDRVFVQNMELDLGGATALMGVHTLGRAKPENSGYDGWWSDPDNSRLFNNNYFVSLLAKGWMPERLPSGKHQWTRSDRGANTQIKEMMLNTDICFLYKEDNQPVNAGEELSGFEQPCCAWVDSFVIGGDQSGDGHHTGVIENNGGDFCGTDCTTLSGCNGGLQERSQCCGSTSVTNDCGDPRAPNGQAARFVKQFAEDDLAWARDFGLVWKKATENGFGSLQAMADQCTR
jgi:hypothetical protein